MQIVNDCDTSLYGKWNTIFGDSVRPVKKKKESPTTITCKMNQNLTITLFSVTVWKAELTVKDKITGYPICPESVPSSLESVIID